MLMGIISLTDVMNTHPRTRGPLPTFSDEAQDTYAGSESRSAGFFSFRPVVVDDSPMK
jgi:hypothetical protein